MLYKILTVGDIHFGYYPPNLLYNEFKNMIDSIDDSFDAVIIVGDYFDTKLSLSSKHVSYAMKAFKDLVMSCIENNIKLRMIRGTSSHDPENQLNNLATIANATNCDFRLFHTVDEEELFPEFNILYIPEEYMEDKNEYYKEYFNKKYTGIFGHGMFEETSFSTGNKHSMKKYPIFNSEMMEELCDGPIIFGHIHKHQIIRNRIAYTGSYTRSRFGEEEDKGYIVAKYDTDSKETYFEFKVNEEATRYDTIEIEENSSLFSSLLNEQIKYLRDLESKFKKDKLRIVINIPEGYVNKQSFIDNIKVIFNNNKDTVILINDNSTSKNKKEAREKIDRLVAKYGFIFDKSINYDLKIQMFLSVKEGVDMSIDKIRKLTSGN